MFAQLVYSKKFLSQVAQVVLREIQDFFLAYFKTLAKPETQQPRTKAAICTCAR